MIVASRIFAICLILIGIVALIIGLSYPITMKQGILAGAGFMPVILSSALILLSIRKLLNLLKESAVDEEPFIDKEAIKRHLLFLSTFIACTILTYVLGMVVAFGLFVIFLLIVLEKISVLKSISIGFGIIGFILIVFQYWLEINFISGLFF